MSARLSDPVATALDASSYASLRRKWLEEGISGKTLNNELGYICAAFNELKDLGQIDYGSPLAGVRLLKLQERELSWLTTEQISELLDSIRGRCDNPHTELVTLLCLATPVPDGPRLKSSPRTDSRATSRPMPEPRQGKSATYQF